MARITETRITLAAFIYGIETDLKNLIKKYITPFQDDILFFQDRSLELKVIDRFNKENPGVDYRSDIDEIVDFIDFHDTFIILRKNNVFLPKNAADYLEDIFSELAEITPIRNRVMHTRPLLAGDFSKVYDFIQKLTPRAPIDWRISLETRDIIEKDPTYLLTLRIPAGSNYEDRSRVIHNLPIPYFVCGL